MGTKPVNKYLPPRARRDDTTLQPEHLPVGDGSAIERLFAWSDSFLTARTAKPAAKVAAKAKDSVMAAVTKSVKGAAKSVAKAVSKPRTPKH
jgi:hypothetical protein